MIKKVAYLSAQVDHSIMVSMFISIHLIIISLSKGFPGQISVAFTQMYRYDVCVYSETYKIIVYISLVYCMSE